MRRKKVGRLAGLALVTLLATPGGCSGFGRKREAESAIRAYNEALIVAYRTNDPGGLEKVAGENEVRKLVALIDLKRQGSLALESRLEEFEVIAAESAGEELTIVRTRERWRYWDRALRPGMSPGPVFLADMWMTWELGREKGAWKVLNGRTDRSDYLEPKGFRPGQKAAPAGGAK